MKTKYDAIIIGSGVGGLVCGSYLVANGLKVLIVEQNAGPGGYCISFHRNGYRFDAAVHYLGGMQKGIMGTILRELGLFGSLRFNQLDIPIQLVYQNYNIAVHSDISKTIENLNKVFPLERKKIEKFFDYIYVHNFFLIYSKIKKLSFKALLDKFFDCNDLKNFFSALTLASIGLNSRKVSAVTAVALFRQYFSDFGYYPIGGAQSFTDTFVKKYREHGGEIVFSKRANEILTCNGEVCGVSVEDGDVYYSKNVISNIDDNKTSRILLKTKDADTVKKMTCSGSFFSLFLGINNKFSFPPKTSDFIYIFNKSRINGHSQNDIVGGLVNWMICCFPFINDDFLEKKVIEIFTIVPYVSRNFWGDYKKKYAKRVLNRLEKIFPGIISSIDCCEIATPRTYERYTDNFHGAAFGYSSTVNQIKATLSPYKTQIRGLYRAGHWSTTGTGQGGVASVALSGRSVAQLITESFNVKWPYKLLNL
jgi:phytoene dehydrogenase-like protein